MGIQEAQADGHALDALELRILRVWPLVGRISETTGNRTATLARVGDAQAFPDAKAIASLGIGY
jgi:hypothetical protein